MITIIDYGMGNLKSIQNMLKYLGVTSKISNNTNEIEKAVKIILPGVGAFDNAMRNIHNMGLKEVLDQKVCNEKIPVLGICLGMQLLTEQSQEGSLNGLSYIKGESVKFNFSDSIKLKIPQMGWNTVYFEKDSFLTKSMNGEQKFYFVHSYHVVCKDPSDILCQTLYGYSFTSALSRENIYGVQFHPEKSHRFGMQLLKNFSEL